MQLVLIILQFHLHPAKMSRPVLSYNGDNRAHKRWIVMQRSIFPELAHNGSCFTGFKLSAVGQGNPDPSVLDPIPLTPSVHDPIPLTPFPNKGRGNYPSLVGEGQGWGHGGRGGVMNGRGKGDDVCPYVI